MAKPQFSLRQRVAVPQSSAQGVVIAITLAVQGEPGYQLAFLSASGSMQQGWFSESELARAQGASEQI